MAPGTGTMAADPVGWDLCTFHDTVASHKSLTETGSWELKEQVSALAFVVWQDELLCWVDHSHWEVL